mgnify:CR=1 FL=1
MIYEVHVWQMTEEERLAYIAKHPIKEHREKSGRTFGSQDKEKMKARSKKGANSTKEMWKKKMAEKESNNED